MPGHPYHSPLKVTVASLHPTLLFISSSHQVHGRDSCELTSKVPFRRKNCGKDCALQYHFCPPSLCVYHFYRFVHFQYLQTCWIWGTARTLNWSQSPWRGANTTIPAASRISHLTSPRCPFIYAAVFFCACLLRSRLLSELMFKYRGNEDIQVNFVLISNF